MGFFYFIFFYQCFILIISQLYSLPFLSLELARFSYSKVQHGTVAKPELCVPCLNTCTRFTSHSGTHESRRKSLEGWGLVINKSKN